MVVSLTKTPNRSIFRIAIVPAFKTYTITSILGVWLFLGYAFIYYGPVLGNDGLIMILGAIFVYPAFSLAIGLLIAFPPILLIGATLLHLAIRHHTFRSPWIAAIIGIPIGSIMLMLITNAIYMEPTFCGPALLGGICGLIGALLFHHFAGIKAMDSQSH